jgi:hypothetical protein
MLGLLYFCPDGKKLESSMWPFPHPEILLGSVITQAKENRKGAKDAKNI